MTQFIKSLICFGLVAQSFLSARAVTLQVSPSSITATVPTDVVISVGGVGSGEKVKIERVVDVNGNGSVDAEDFVIESFFVTDNALVSIGAIINSNVPADTNSNPGTIAVHLNSQAGTEVQRASGKFIYRVSGSSGSALSAFTVTQPSSTEKIQGKLLSGGNPVAGAVVGVLVPVGDDNRFVTGAFTGSDGSYSVSLAPGFFQLIGLKPGYVGNFGQAAAVNLAAGQTATADVTIQAATGRTISGTISDAADGAPILSTGQIFASDDAGDYAVTLVKSDSTYVFQGPAGQWKLELGRADIVQAGYVGQDQKLRADTTGGNATVNASFQKAASLFYGTIKNGQTGLAFDVPLQVFAQDENHTYQVELTSGIDGTYSAGVVPGNWYLSINTSDNPALSGYVVSEGGPLSISAGQAVKFDFVVQPATHTISGLLKDSSNNPIPFINVNANAFVNNQSFQAQATTDSQGRFSFPVIDAAWNVSADGQSLSDLGLQAPPNQIVTVNGADANVTLIAAAPTAHIQGKVVDENGVPVTGIRVIASGGNSFSNGQTDNSGAFNIGVSAGTWTVQLETSSAAQMGFVSSTVNVTVINGETKTNVIVVAHHSTFKINGVLKADTGEPIANAFVYVGMTVNSINYFANAQTASDGTFSLNVFNGNWSISTQDLTSYGLEAPQAGPVVVNNADASVTLTGRHPAAAPTLSGLKRLANGTVQFHINDSSVSRSITIQATSDFKNWDTSTPILTTGAGFDYTDPFAAQYQRRFYKILRQ